MRDWECMWAMSDPRNIDEDAILKGLSAEELEQLECELQEMDPEVWSDSKTCQALSFDLWHLGPRELMVLFKPGVGFSGHRYIHSSTEFWRYHLIIPSDHSNMQPNLQTRFNILCIICAKCILSELYAKNTMASSIQIQIKKVNAVEAHLTKEVL